MRRGTRAQEALEALARPLDFAAQDEFARIERVRELPRAVMGGLDRLGALAIPRDLVREVDELRKLFRGSWKEGEGRAAVERALRGLAPFRDPGWPERALASSPRVLPGIGSRRAAALERRGLSSVADLLFHLPQRYDDRRSLVGVGDLQVGRRATFVARVLGAGFGTWRGRGGHRGGRLFEARVGDDSGSVNLKWFRGGEAISQVVKKDADLLITGDVKRYRFELELQHPEVEPFRAPEDAAQSGAGRRRVIPEYATPDGLNPRGFREAIRHAARQYADLVEGHLPESLVVQRKLPEVGESLLALHDPHEDADLEALEDHATPYHERLVLEELYLLEVGLALRRAAGASTAGVALSPEALRVEPAIDALPFELTGAQQRVWREIREDLARPHPMNRLLEGDVGSGKTVVAFLAGCAAAAAGHQTALMAPTELLAEQHFRTLRSLSGAGASSAPRVELLTASQPRGHAEALRADLADGDLDIIVGTHALLQEGVRFRSLALVVVDEQHRFGVSQRATLAEKGASGAMPHTLVMTATPIPRTLALTLHGDLDLSVIDELPPGRHPPRTWVAREGEGRQVAELLSETTQRGEQVYVVYPLVEESEKMDLRAASESAERIRKAFPGVEVDLVHGRLDAAQRREVMARFESGDTHVLVSTTVVEVGVDVSNATLMIVEHAERFGLAQLHQLRGRVGRGERPGTCVYVARGTGADSEARLEALLATGDGFAIAEADLRIRGPGEFLGTRQHGRLPELRIADLLRDVKLLALSRDVARAQVRSDPRLSASPELARAVQARWGKRLRLSGVG